MNHQSRIPDQQGIGQTLPPVPVGIDMMHANPLPSGAMPSGTRLQVGKYRVIIHNFFAEGGFAHVYLARIEGKQGYVVLKRVAVPDAERLATVEKEIAFMRRLGDHKYITRYYESRIDPLPIGGYEALILMEYCPGGGVIDLMNRRLQQRLTEPEILSIFNCVCQAVAYMHYCQPAVLHRDLKVENILILGQDHYKLCDFGSAALSNGSHVPTSLQEIQHIQDDIQRHTTLQYRAPEMVDLYQKKPINEKADIWALGVLLYKLCYYTTPFEQQGELAILNAHYQIPSNPPFSAGMRQLIMSMLRENQNDRPNIYQVVKHVADLMHMECPIRDIYSASPSQGSANVSEPGSRTESPASIFEKVPSAAQPLPNITPMRRGRPTRTSTPPAAAASPAPHATSAPPQRDAFDPFDPSHVRVHGDRVSSSSSSSPSGGAATGFGFDSQFAPSPNLKVSPSRASYPTSDDDSGSIYSIHLESQLLDPISIPPHRAAPPSSSSMSQTPITSPSTAATTTNSSSYSSGSLGATNNNKPVSSPIIHTPPPPPTTRPRTSSTSVPATAPSAAKTRPRTSSVNNGIPQTTSTRGIREFMERKAAANASSDNDAPATDDLQQQQQKSPANASIPMAAANTKPTPVAAAAAAPPAAAASTNPSTPYRPKPPPKPARFRSKPTNAAGDDETTTQTAPVENRPSSPDIAEFESKFPDLSELQ